MNATPRKYFHMLIALDKDTLRPLYHSNSFYFLNVGIEYCIGFTVKEENFIFWISQNDRETLYDKSTQNSHFIEVFLIDFCVFII